MAAPPVELFAMRIEPGETVPVQTERDVVITNVCFASEEALKKGTTILKLHHVKVDNDWDSDDELASDDEDEDSDEDEELPDASTASKKNAKGKKEVKEAKEAKEAKETAEEDDEDEDEDVDLADDVEEKEYAVARLTSGHVEQVTLNLQISSEELVALSVAGSAPQAVDVIGSYLAPPPGFDEEPDSDEEITSDESDAESDNEEGEHDSKKDSSAVARDDTEDEAVEEESEVDEQENETDKQHGVDADDVNDDDVGSIVEEFSDEEDAANALSLRADLKRILAGESVSDDDQEDASDRIKEIKEPVKATGKRAREEKDEGDVTADATHPDLAAAAAAEGLDVNSLSKSQKKRLNKKLRTPNGSAGETPKASEATKKAAAEPKKAAKKDDKPEEQSSAKRTVAGGLVIEDKKAGTGAAAKKGSKISMRYVGKLTSGKIFDQNTSGKPFAFRLGAGQVIKGWDVGVEGMRVGGERRLTIPAAMGYGRAGAGPIPGNATLVFDVKLVALR